MKNPLRIRPLLDRRKNERRHRVVENPADNPDRRHRVDVQNPIKKWLLNRKAVAALKKGEILAVCANCGAERIGGTFYNTGKTKKDWDKLVLENREKHGIEMHLTHGICGTCTEKLYPEIVAQWREQGK